jgi:hypothetical protein
MRHGRSAAEAIDAVKRLPVTTFDVDLDLVKRAGEITAAWRWPPANGRRP